MDKIAEELSGIKTILEKQNEITRGILNVMQKPQNKVKAMLEIFVLIAGTLAVLGSAEIRRAWLTGG